MDNELGKPHIDKALAAEAPTPEYRWHKFWTRKPHNVVGEYVEHYSDTSEIVLDPFSGSGVTVIEAVRRNRLGIAIDIVPPAIEILRATLEPVSVQALDRGFRQLEQQVKRQIDQLYLTTCRNCQARIPFTCMVWIADQPSEVRYQCPHCGHQQESGCTPDTQDLDLLQAVEKEPVHQWYPTNTLCYPDGAPFMKGENHESVDKLFTPRNLRALALLLSAINSLPGEARTYLRTAFSSMVHLASKLSPVRQARPFAAFWAQHSFWVAPEGYMEMNAWHLYESAYRGRQGLRRAKVETNKDLKQLTEAPDLAHLGRGKHKYLAICDSALLALRQLPDNSVGYVFTDPPYAASIQFGELSYIWVSWLHPELSQDAYLAGLVDHEVVVNDSQSKDFDRYYTLLYATFQEVYRVLKPGRYMTVTFHNPKTRVRNATIRAATFSGFDYEKIIYQPPAITSYKSLLQPFGSAQGDFFFRFRKPSPTPTVSMQQADRATFERIVVETTKQVLAERGEPTPYTHIINYVDPVLAGHGYFLSLDPEVDIDDVLKAHTGPGKEFRLVEQKIHNVAGEAWWFQDTDIVYRLRHVPLAERVEATILRLLKRKHTVTFTQALDAVFTEFPNALTPDTTNVKDVLAEYAEQTAKGLWRISKTVSEEETAHSEMIYILARIGKRLKYDVWIGKREQAQSWMLTRLDRLMTRPALQLRGLSPRQLARLEMVDLIWYRQGVLKCLFEVESTTMLTDAIIRASNLPYPAERYMVVPSSRNHLLHRKMGSPLFKELFDRDQWQILYFDDVRSLGHRKGVTLAAITAKAGLRPLDPKKPRARRAVRREKAPQLSFDELEP